jgi:hypothetical protein
MSVPRMVATSVDVDATIRLLATASARPGRPSGFSHASSENCLKTRLERPVGSLKLNRIITATGRIR